MLTSEAIVVRQEKVSVQPAENNEMARASMGQGSKTPNEQDDFESLLPAVFIPTFTFHFHFCKMNL